ncbi:hypothetical protein SAMN05443637_1358 [Pseudonocardia thermophila]|uniref:Helix-turn-helix domain-containing protein n=1 Tax=Pseudonocardia thermophila TaxID=1848 RepID=A0A1M7BD62_PSETH|nr:hypothetical protein [Pseudonocardia thermophila]SHL52968.1 hypothetical protein SAMN05443637_1358 [Pseudonocardia thermophila]
MGTTWHVSITTGDQLDDNQLVELVRALPARSSAGRAPTGGLRVVTALAAAEPEQAIAAARVVLASALLAIDCTPSGELVAAEAVAADESERRDELAAGFDPLAQVIDADEAASILGVTASAVRQRGEGLHGRRLRSGGWIFHRATIETIARERAELRSREP